MSEIPVAVGPPCDLCGEFPAVLSLMNLADYSQIKGCGNCAPEFLRTIADSIDGRVTALPDTETAELAADVDAAAADAGAQAPELGADDDDGQGSARDHWASTTNVRRSTHGHRTPRASSGKPERATDE